MSTPTFTSNVTIDSAQNSAPTSTPVPVPKQTILIVDDHAENLLVAGEILREGGYVVRTALSGEAALRSIAEREPDLIITDIMMPQMDGFMLCRTIKATQQMAHIPVMFITAVADMRSVKQGFAVGGVDYITKPFHNQEMLARVYAHLSLKSVRDELAERNTLLRELNEEKNNLLSITAHDLKNPIATIMTASVMITKHFDRLQRETILDNVGIIQETAERMTNIINNLLDINKIESGRLQPQFLPIGMNTAIMKAVNDYRERAASKSIVLDVTIPDAEVFVEGDALMMMQSLDNLISNAIKFSPLGNSVRITMELVPKTEDAHAIRLTVWNKSAAISDTEKQKLFRKFTRLSTRPTDGENSTGLGLYIVKRFVEAMQGRVWCDSRVDDGVSFVLEFAQSTTLRRIMEQEQS
jgi:two-component system, sensor histidine kinase and response regulator